MKLKIPDRKSIRDDRQAVVFTRPFLPYADGDVAVFPKNSPKLMAALKSGACFDAYDSKRLAMYKARGAVKPDEKPAPKTREQKEDAVADAEAFTEAKAEAQGTSAGWRKS